MRLCLMLQDANDTESWQEGHDYQSLGDDDDDDDDTSLDAKDEPSATEADAAESPQIDQPPRCVPTPIAIIAINGSKESLPLPPNPQSVDVYTIPNKGLPNESCFSCRLPHPESANASNTTTTTITTDNNSTAASLYDFDFAKPMFPDQDRIFKYMRNHAKPSPDWPAFDVFATLHLVGQVGQSVGEKKVEIRVGLVYDPEKRKKKKGVLYLCLCDNKKAEISRCFSEQVAVVRDDGIMTLYMVDFEEKKAVFDLQFYLT
jgi:hypothetical protein